MQQRQRTAIVREGVDRDDLSIGVRAGSGYAQEPALVQVHEVDRRLGGDLPPTAVGVEQLRNPSVAGASWPSRDWRGTVLRLLPSGSVRRVLGTLASLLLWLETIARTRLISIRLLRC